MPSTQTEQALDALTASHATSCETPLDVGSQNGSSTWGHLGPSAATATETDEPSELNYTPNATVPSGIAAAAPGSISVSFHRSSPMSGGSTCSWGGSQ